MVAPRYSTIFSSQIFNLKDTGLGGKDWGQYDVFWLIVVCPHCCPCFHRRCLSLPLAAVVVVCQHYCHCRRRHTHCPCSSRRHHCLCSSSVSVATIPMPLFLMQLPLTFRHGRGIYQKALACMCSNILNITAEKDITGRKEANGDGDGDGDSDCDKSCASVVGGHCGPAIVAFVVGPCPGSQNIT